MQLTKLQVINFKRITSVSLELGDLNILVGGNSSGKSSIIQAVHLACCVMRQASSVERGKTSTVGIDELDYLPTDNYKMLGHDNSWGNKVGTPSSRMKLTFERDGEIAIESATAECELRSARNAGISITGNVPLSLSSLLRSKRKFFSAYIPGISGIPNREEKRSKKVILKACSYGDSNIILRNALLLLKEQGDISKLETWLRQIIGPMKLLVEHDDAKDLVIDCQMELNGSSIPIELIGTGYLQLIQIFTYILLFSPGILLVDEPDTHLHPTVQEKLVQVLAQVANERQLRILLTTHSPFIVRGAPLSAKVYWVKDGVIEPQNRNAVELALGWGAFGKKVIIVSEDSNTGLLKKLVAQWPEIDKLVAIHPGMGCKNLAKPTQAADIRDALGRKYKILVHRDRDSLTDEEVCQLEQTYTEHGVYLWCPDMSDVEAYYCQPEFLKDIVGCSGEEACAYVQQILDQQAVKIQDQFRAQRRAHNDELHPAGGSPPNEEVWEGFQARCLKGAKGKFVFGQLKTKIPGGVFKEDAIMSHTSSAEIAPSLKTKLQELLANEQLMLSE